MKIEWTTPGLLDLEAIRDYIRRDSEYYALRFVARILEAVDQLAFFPSAGRIVPEASDTSIRELIFQNYRIMYRLKPDCIQVLAVIHGARDVASKEKKPWEIC